MTIAEYSNIVIKTKNMRSTISFWRPTFLRSRVLFWTKSLETRLLNTNDGNNSDNNIVHKNLWQGLPRPELVAKLFVPGLEKGIRFQCFVLQHRRPLQGEQEREEHSPNHARDETLLNLFQKFLHWSSSAGTSNFAKLFITSSWKTRI